MSTPDFETLAAREDVWHRETTHAVDADRLAEARASVEAGLTWAVGAVVTDDAGRVLLVREDDQWLAPGGKVESGETHQEAVRREVREETGVEVAVGDIVAVTEVGFEHGADRVAFWFAHYTADPETTALAADPGRDGEGIDRVEWVEQVPAGTVDREVVVANR
jgi:8-oxo-dGTP diphosphatase